MKPILDYGRHDRPTARGLRLNPLQLAELLTGAFDRIGDFLGDLLRAGPGVGRDNQCLLDRELGVLQPPHPLVCHDPAQDEEGHHEEGNALLKHRKYTRVHGCAP